MTPELDTAMQFGAVGLLGMTIAAGIQLLQRAIKGPDRIEESVKSLTAVLQAVLLEQERRQPAQQAFYERLEHMTLKQLELLQSLGSLTEKIHAATMTKIEEASKETRHAIRNDLQLIELRTGREANLAARRLIAEGKSE